MNEELEQTNLIMFVKMPSNECVTDIKNYKGIIKQNLSKIFGKLYFYNFQFI